MVSDYLSMKELAARMNLSERTLRAYLGGPGGIPYHRLHPKGKILIRWEDVVEWMETKRIAADKALEDPVVREILEDIGILERVH